MERTKCCMIGCENDGSQSVIGGNRRFHVFPVNFDLCMLWVENCGRPEFFEDFAFAGAQPFTNRHVCSAHFSDRDFIDPKNRLSGLLPTAIPNLNLLCPKVEVKDEQEHFVHFVEVKDEQAEFTKTVEATLDSDSEILIEIKVEKLDNEISDELGANFSFSSADDSCNDAPEADTPDGIRVYQQTEQDKQLSDEFFRKYDTAVSRSRSNKRVGETDEERTYRLRKEAARAKIRRSLETDEQKRKRRMKNALRAAFRRQNETPEQRELRKKKDMLRAQRRRNAETESEARVRRHNDAVRAAYRRNNETEEQRTNRKMKDIVRAAKRRSMETPEERETRLRKDRERATKRRMFKKMANQITQLSRKPEYAQLMIPIRMGPTENGVPRVVMRSIQSIVADCNDVNAEPNLESLQQVLDFIHSMSNRGRKRRRAFMQKGTDIDKDIGYVDVIMQENGVANVDLAEIIDIEGKMTDEKRRGSENRYLSDVAGSNGMPCVLDKRKIEGGRLKGDSGNDCRSTDVDSEIGDAGVDMEGIVDFLEPEVVWG